LVEVNQSRTFCRAGSSFRLRDGGEKKKTQKRVVGSNLSKLTKRRKLAEGGDRTVIQKARKNRRFGKGRKVWLEKLKKLVTEGKFTWKRKGSKHKASGGGGKEVFVWNAVL